MLERKYSVVSIFKDMWREKIITIIVVIVCIVLGAGAGFATYKKEASAAANIANQINSAPVEGEDDYITQLRDYEDSLVACEEALALAEEQRDTIQEAIDNSIVMKMDPTNVQVAYVAYVVADTSNAGNILNAINSYINDGGLKEDALTKGGENLEIESWREIISVGITGNNLFITITHYDADKVKEVMAVVKKCVEDETTVISKTQGEYNLNITDEAYYTKSDVNIANTQNNNNNNLKNYTNSVADQTNKVNNLKTTIDTFKEKNEIKDGASVSRGLPKTLVIFAAAGFIGGIILSFAISAIKAILSDKIDCADHLQYAGITVFNKFVYKKDAFSSDIEETVSEIKSHVKKSGSNSLCVYELSDIENNKKVSELLKNKIDVDVKNNAGISETEDVVVVLTSRKDKYSSLEDVMSKCARLGVKFLGVIVCE